MGVACGLAIAHYLINKYIMRPLNNIIKELEKLIDSGGYE